MSFVRVAFNGFLSGSDAFSGAVTSLLAAPDRSRSHVIVTSNLGSDRRGGSSLDEDNIAFIKKQQWIVVGYGFTVHAAIVTISKQLNSTFCIRLILTAFAAGAALYGIIVLKGFNDGMIKWRARLDWVYEKWFENGERIELRLGQRPPLTEFIFIGGLSLTLLCSAFVVSLAIWCGK